MTFVTSFRILVHYLSPFYVHVYNQLPVGTLPLFHMFSVGPFVHFLLHLNALSNFVDTMWGITTWDILFSYFRYFARCRHSYMSLLIYAELKLTFDGSYSSWWWWTFYVLFITFIYLTVIENLYKTSCFISYMNLYSWTTVLFWIRGLYFNSKPLAMYCWSVSLEMWDVIWKRKENIFHLCSSCTSAHRL